MRIARRSARNLGLGVRHRQVVEIDVERFESRLEVEVVDVGGRDRRWLRLRANRLAARAWLLRLRLHTHRVVARARRQVTRPADVALIERVERVTE